MIGAVDLLRFILLSQLLISLVFLPPSLLCACSFQMCFIVTIVRMESVRVLGVNVNAPASESSAVLASASLSQLLSARNELFSEATSLGDTKDGDELVSRRDSRKNPLNQKLSDDVINLLMCIKNETPVSRSLLKNGKRNKEYLDISRSVNVESSVPSIPSSSSSSSSQTAGHRSNPSSSDRTWSDSVRTTTMMKDINLLKNEVEVKDLKRDIALLHRQNHSTAVPSTCHVRITFPQINPISATHLNIDVISKLLGCPALSVVKVSGNTLKAKIPKECLYTALVSSQSSSHFVHVWRKKLSTHSIPSPPEVIVQVGSLYTESLGTVPATHYHKYCHNYRKGCNVVQFYGYHRDRDHRLRYDHWMTLPYFLSSQETGFELEMLRKFDVELLIGQISYKQKADIYNISNGYDATKKQCSMTVKVNPVYSQPPHGYVNMCD